MLALAPQRDFAVCCRSPGTDVSSLQHELALDRAPPPPHPCIPAFYFGDTGKVDRGYETQTFLTMAGMEQNSPLCREAFAILLRPALALDLLLLDDASLPLGL